MINTGETTLRSAFDRRWPAFLLVVATLLALGATSAANADARPFWTGVTNIGNNEPLAFERTRATGARFIRIPLLWNEVAPGAQPAGWRPEDPADPNYRWTDADTNVIRAVAAGLTPVLQIVVAPKWAQRCPTPSVLPDAECDPDPAALAAFATAVARRYSGGFAGLPRVQYWQGLNEPNLSLFFFPQFDTSGKTLSPGLYRVLINTFYDAIKAVDPTNLVVAAGLGPIAVPKWTIGPMRFARDLLCMSGHNNPKPSAGNCGGGIRFDIFAIQPYTTGGPTHVGGINDVQLGGLGKLRTLINAADRANRIQGKFAHTPLWITEFSWDSAPPDPGGLPMEIETRWTAEAMYRAWRVGVDTFFWFSLHDDQRTPSSPSFANTLESGLYFRGPTLEQDQPKEVLHAFRFPFVAYARKAGLFAWGRTPSSGPGKVRIEVWTGSSWRKAMTVTASASGVFTGIAKTGYGKNKQGLVRAVFEGQGSAPFAMKPVPDFKQPPFG